MNFDEKKITIVITDFFKDREKRMCLNYFLMTINLCTFPENYHGSNTGFLVAGLVSIVSGVFLTFALVALCYRSSVVHKNITLCLRLVRYLTWIIFNSHQNDPKIWFLMVRFLPSLSLRKLGIRLYKFCTS